jgi:hypothetical protein
MTTRKLAVVAVLAAATGAACLAKAATPPAATPAAESVTAELALLRAQFAALQQRLEQLEAAQQSQLAKTEEVQVAQASVNSELQDSIDRTADNLARAVGEGASSGWMGRWVWRGDLRVRNEYIDQEATASSRNRNRFRLRVGALARVNENTRVELQFATAEGSDARSSNQSFSDANSRKPLDLELAYGEWSPNDRMRITAGKMRYPWARTSSFFFDNDLNPEGVAVAWQQAANGFFGSAFVTELAERAAAADTLMLGAQIGWRSARSDGSRMLVAGAYYDHQAARGYNPFQGASAGSAGFGSFGNSTTTSSAVCRRAVAPGAACLANDYDIVELLGEYQFTFAERPLLLYGNVARNLAADHGVPGTTPATSIPAGLDTAWAVGFNYGRADAVIPGSWEIGYLYQVIEKDALFGQWIDSDFAAGNTDGGGGALRAAWQMSRNVRFNVTYMLNDTNLDIPAAVTLPSTRLLTDRDYQRLQVDVTWAY